MSKVQQAAGDKRQLRKEMLAIRQALSAEEARERSARVRARARETALYRQAEKVCLYWPIRGEVDVRPLSEEKEAYLPRICEGRMEFYRFHGAQALKPGAFGIPEPDGEEKLIPDERTLIVMPGLAFSPRRDRLGYGGGYYDEYLTRHRDVHTLAVAYDFQIVETLPQEAHDRRPEGLVTESASRF